MKSMRNTKKTNSITNNLNTVSSQISISIEISGSFPICGGRQLRYFRRTGFTLLELLIVLGLIVV
ncbi:MAG: prepilin-type N-terminal cleavage/methylation domain-containing protein, partial [Planctomycetaceae bacterium]|nr:prepilin-type N-terminal cleavage/methylation domain-containing protein [Planctomycetaceae bacterium]